MDLTDPRPEFGKYTMEENNLPDNPLVFFKNWFKQAEKEQVSLPNAMVLSTVGQQGKPSSRVVLLKEIQPNGNLVFYTNYQSRKGEEIGKNRFVALNFFWHEQERQVRIEGMAEKTSVEDSDRYFNSRPQESRISAMLSPQSSVIGDFSALKKKVMEWLQKRRVIERPGHWGGYSVTPDYYEFWQGGKNRLHDRIRYVFQDGKWDKARLAP